MNFDCGLFYVLIIHIFEHLLNYAMFVLYLKHNTHHRRYTSIYTYFSETKNQKSYEINFRRKMEYRAQRALYLKFSSLNSFTIINESIPSSEYTKG